MIRPLVALAVLPLAGSGACADEVSFKGKTITMVVGYAAGGGTDLSGRLIASLLGRHLPGEPAVVMPRAGGASSNHRASY